MTVLGGLNDYVVSAVRWVNMSKESHRCLWLGFKRFRCGKCLKGYFDVRSPNDFDEICPNCNFKIEVTSRE